MINPSLTIAQLSREELARAIRGGFERESAAPTLLLVFIVALAGVMLWLAWRNRTQEVASDRTPLKIFNDLAREFHLSLIDRWLLIRIARAQSLPSPITLMVSPRTMRQHAGAYASSLTKRRRAGITRRIARLRRSLFL